MPGRLFLTTPMASVALALQADATAVAAQPPRHNIAPGQEIAVLGPDRRLVPMRWGIIPVGRVNARGRPVMETLVNVRSETLFEKSAFRGLRRAVVPADGWYEWTGKARRKTAHAIRAAQDELLLFAAVFDVWTAPGGRAVPQVATVTCPPNADVRDIHHRMGVLLTADGARGWLDGDDTAAAALMRPWPDGGLHVGLAGAVDWDAP